MLLHRTNDLTSINIGADRFGILSESFPFDPAVDCNESAWRSQKSKRAAVSKWVYVGQRRSGTPVVFQFLVEWD